MSALHPAQLAGPDVGGDRRDCYTCRFSPPFPGLPDCAALTMDEAADADIVDFCERSGTNANDGWPPPGNGMPCPRWSGR